MVKVAFVRGAYLNNFEGQNYIFDDIELRGFSSKKAIHRQLPFPVTRLPSIADWAGSSKVLKFIANRTLGDIQNLFGLENYAQEFDIFHTADPHYYYSYQLARLRRAGKIRKLLVTSWETIPCNNESAFAKRQIKRFVLETADHFLCYTVKAAKALSKEGVDESKISVIPLGVNTTVFSPKKIEEHLPVTYLFAGRLVPEKGVLDAYDAYRQIAGKENRLHIVGSGPLKKQLKVMAAEDHLEKQVTIEDKEYGEMPEAYRQADVFILPSRKTGTWEEQYGMVLVEALASGLPVIACDTGAIGEVVGKAGFLIHEGDIKTIAGTMRRLADWQLRAKVGTMGRERAEKIFNARQSARKIARMYRDLL